MFYPSYINAHLVTTSHTRAMTWVFINARKNSRPLWYVVLRVNVRSKKTIINGSLKQVLSCFIVPFYYHCLQK